MCQPMKQIMKTSDTTAHIPFLLLLSLPISSLCRWYRYHLPKEKYSYSTRQISLNAVWSDSFSWLKNFPICVVFLIFPFFIKRFSLVLLGWSSCEYCTEDFLLPLLYHQFTSQPIIIFWEIIIEKTINNCCPNFTWSFCKNDLHSPSFEILHSLT